METPSFRLVDGTSALASSSPFEAEFAKDRWDAHNIPGLRYPAHTSHYHIWFTIVPVNWRLPSKSMRSILWPQIELHIPSTIGCDNLDIFCTSFHNTILGPLISTN